MIKSFLNFIGNPKQYSFTNFIILLILILFIQASIVSLHIVTSESMEDTLLVGDVILVAKTWYGFKPPLFQKPVTPGYRVKHDDIVICAFPGDPTKEFVKRCVAKGGDTLGIKAKQLIVNGNFIPLPKTGKHTDPELLQKHDGKRDFYPASFVPKDSLFVLGDNRDFSFDSRSWGFLPKKNLKGKVIYLLWSLDPNVSWTNITHKFRSGRFFKKVE